jgi:hypothetical protein
MWISKYIDCLEHGHTLSAITHEGSAYQYCLRCGQLKPQESRETAGAGAGQPHSSLEDDNFIAS